MRVNTQGENIYMTIINGCNDGITIIKDAKVVFANPKLTELLGYKLQEVINSPMANFIAEEDRQLTANRYARRMKGEQVPSRYEIKLLAKNNSKIPVEVNIALIEYEGKPAEMAIIRDFTERNRLDSLKNEFISTISHEFRTPISIMNESISQVIDGLHGNINDWQKKILAMALNNIKRLTRLTNNLLDISKIEAGKLFVKHETFDIIEASNELIQDLSAKAKEKGLEIKPDYSKSMIELCSDKDKVIEIFTNLLSNAIKFTDKGNIYVSITDLDNEVKCSIKDTGRGISPENIQHVFNKFMQFERAYGPGEKGTGLGLSIAKGLIEALGGKINVESKLGDGTKFIFTIPKASLREVDNNG